MESDPTRRQQDQEQEAEKALAAEDDTILARAKNTMALLGEDEAISASGWEDDGDIPRPRSPLVRISPTSQQEQTPAEIQAGGFLRVQPLRPSSRMSDAVAEHGTAKEDVDTGVTLFANRSVDSEGHSAFDRMARADGTSP